MRSLRERLADDRGSASLEAAIVVPAFILFIGLLVFAGRTAVAGQALDAVAYEAARSASLARSPAEAHARAQAAADATLSNYQLRCAAYDVDVDTSGMNKPAGQWGQVNATVTCTIDLSDLSVPGVPGQRRLSATASSPVDTWRVAP